MTTIEQTNSTIPTEANAIIAVEVNDKGEDLTICWISCPKVRPVEQKIRGAYQAIASLAYKNWIGRARVKWVDTVLARGNRIEFRPVLMPFNGKTAKGVGITAAI